MPDDDLSRLLRDVADRRVAPDVALERLTTLRNERSSLLTPNGEARVDLDRQRRCRFPEVVYGPGKTPETILEVFRCQQERGQPSLATRVSPEQAAAVAALFPDASWNRRAGTIRLAAASGPASSRVGHICVLMAGTSDLPVAEEAAETLQWAGVGCEVITDCGVAGPQRLLEQLPRLEGADVVIVVAGMEGALPSVVGGWVDCPVIAVPTSVGYGASFQGLTALLGMLNSCASNVTVVNIDAGFKAGYLAALIARRRWEGRERRI